MDEKTISSLMGFLQTLSVIVAMLVGFGTLRGRGDDKNTMLVEMRKDIEHIKENTACIPAQGKTIVEIESSCKAAHKRLDDHMRYEHGQKKEETS